MNSLTFRERLEIKSLVIQISPEPVEYSKYEITIYDKKFFNTRQGVSIENLLSMDHSLEHHIFKFKAELDTSDLNDDYFFEDLVLDTVWYHMRDSYKGPYSTVKEIMIDRGLIWTK